MTTTQISAIPRARRTVAAGITGFAAPSGLATDLQAVLVDLIELHLSAKQAHWNITGPGFRSLHLHLDEIVDFARDSSDTIAERMRALDAWPDGRSDTVAARTTLGALPAGEISVSTAVDIMTTRLRAAAATLRTVHDSVDSADPSSADLLHAIIDGLEKHAWMLASEAPGGTTGLAGVVG